MVSAGTVLPSAEVEEYGKYAKGVKMVAAGWWILW